MSNPLPQVMVQGLPASANEDFLEHLFSEVRPVHHPGGVVIKRKTDRRGQPVTYAFVTFDNREDVDHVIAELNYTKLDGAPIRIVHADQDTRDIVRSGRGNLFVKNLDPTIEDSQLHEAFANFGEIVSCKIATDEKRESRGYGYVQFKNESDANQAMSDLKDASINGRPLAIQPFKRRQRLPEDQIFTNVYVKNLPQTVDSDGELAKLFQPFGEITSVKLDGRSGPDGTWMFFGFCNFKDHENAKRAIEGLNGTVKDGKTLECVRFKTRDERVRELQRRSDLWKQAMYERYKGRNLYVRGFDENLTEDELLGLFRPFGEVESVKIVKDEGGVSRKFGFVCFANVEDAQKCIAASALIQFPQTGKQAYVAEMIPANRKRQLNLQTKNQPPRQQADVRPQVAGMPYVGAVREAPQFPIPGVAGIPGFGAGLPTGGPAFGAPMHGEGIAAQPFLPGASSRDRVRQEIFDQTSGNPQQQTTLLNRLKELSDDQVLQLTRNQGLLLQWMQQE